MENFCTVSYAAHNWVYSFQAYFYLIGNLEYSDTRIHPYRNSMQLKKKKKRNYNQRIMQVQQGTFSPLVFSIYGGMGRECQTFYLRLSELLAEKRNIHKSVIMHWIKSKQEC